MEPRPPGSKALVPHPHHHPVPYPAPRSMHLPLTSHGGQPLPNLAHPPDSHTLTQLAWLREGASVDPSPQGGRTDRDNREKVSLSNQPVIGSVGEGYVSRLLLWGLRRCFCVHFAFTFFWAYQPGQSGHYTKTRPRITVAMPGYVCPTTPGGLYWGCMNCPEEKVS